MAQTADSIPLATTVAPGGVAYRVVLGGDWVDGVLVGGEEWSRHARLDTAKDEINRYVLEECRWACPQIWLVPAALRVDIQTLHPTTDSVPTDSVPDPDPEPEPDPDPDPPAEWSPDSTTVYPEGVQASDSVRVTDLHWMVETPYSCVTIADDPGYVEVRSQDVDGLPYWILIPGDADWWPQDCEPSYATLEFLPDEDWAAYVVGPLGDRTPQPVGSTPSVVYDAGSLEVTWEPSPSEWVYYQIALGAQDGSWTASGAASGTTYQTPVQTASGWVCVRAMRAGELSEARCNSWDGGGG